MSSTEIDEKTFVKAFLRLIENSAPDSPEPLSTDFRASPQSLGQNPHTPLIAMPHPKKKSAKHVAGNTGSRAVVLKSIRAPKFTKELANIHLNEAIITIKETLIKEEPLLEGYSPSNLKFLIKGKYIGDAKTLAEVAGDGNELVSFTVMISGERGASKEEAKEEPNTSPTQTPAYLAPSVWSSVYDALVKEKVDGSTAKSLIEECQALIKAKSANQTNE